MALVIDPQVAGISGDMMLSALVDLGADQKRIIQGAEAAARHLKGSTIRKIAFEKRPKRGIMATCLVLDIDEDVSERHGTEIRACIEACAKDIGLSERGTGYALRCVDLLIGAESRIHGSPPESVHFHEASSIDTVIDMLGCATALDGLGILGQDVYCTPVAVGGGTVDFSHGTVPVPAPAVAEILKGTGLQVRGGGEMHELTTPTGAALLAGLGCTPAASYPQMEIESVGYGGGSRDIEKFANVLRLARGGGQGAGDEISVLETNVDDVSGEVIGALIGRVMAAGAKDITVSHAIGKKNRPASLITVLCDRQKEAGLARLLADETGTLGVRMGRASRMVVPRRAESRRITVRGSEFEVRVKVDPGTGRPLKAEFDDIQRVADGLGVPLREAEDLIRNALGR